MFSANENIRLRQFKRQVVGYVESTIPESVLDLGVNVMAMEIACQAPGCVPLETNIVIVFPTSSKELLPGLSESAGGNYKTKILKPLSQVTLDDVLDVLPPAFIGGRQSLERMCFYARDVMLGQITQLLDDSDTAGKTYMAQYLRQCLQDYIDRNCQPPELGEPFSPLHSSSISNNNNNKNVPEDETIQEGNVPITWGTGNIVIQRPKDEDDNDDGTNQNSQQLDNTNNHAKTIKSSNSNRWNRPEGLTPVVADVNTVTRRRQQQAAERYMNQTTTNTNSQTILAQFVEQHAPGIRRPGCPCCDPDHPSNIVDKMMQL